VHAFARRIPRSAVVTTALVMVFTMAGVAAGAGVGINLPNIITPHHENQVTNIDVLRMELKNYYGTPGAATGSGATAGWILPLAGDSYYAKEATRIATLGWNWLNQAANKNTPMRAIVLDVDDTTLTTYNYELFSNWDYNPTTNAVFVGLNPTFTGNLFPPTPGMVDLVSKAKDAGYAIFWITGRGDSQHAATIANLVNDVAAGFTDITTVTYSGATVPEFDAGFPMPTALDIMHGGFTDGLFTKPSVGSYPAYLDKPEFCGPSIAEAKSCPTIQYKSGTRAYIESLGYEIVADFGDQFSDGLGGFKNKFFKMPNPNYYLP
jgi:predicted secreted acid phosphatase